MAPKAPFKGRPATELVSFTKQCLDTSCGEDVQLDTLNELTLFLLDMDSDCLPKIEIKSPSENPTGLLPEAMVEKMDLILVTIIERFQAGVTDSFYHGLLEIFENSVLKLYQPHYIQFITYYLAASTKERADSFLSLLLNIIHDSEADPIARREGISFLGSFVVRTKVLSWTHSARTAKYLVSFMHSLNVSSSSTDRTLFALCLQTVLYVICWECDRWSEYIARSRDLDWVFRSKNSLISLLHASRDSGVLRLVSFDILKTLFPLSGRISVQLRDLIAEGITRYKQLLPPMWKTISESKLLKPNFPFDPFHNLLRVGPLIIPLCREWVDPVATCPDAPDIALDTVKADFSGMEDNNESDHHQGDMEDHDVWSFHPLTRALTSGYLPSPVFGPSSGIANEDFDMMALSSPILLPSSRSIMPPPLDSAIPPAPRNNLILERIISSDKFAKPRV